jgi:hypothetical protein
MPETPPTCAEKIGLASRLISCTLQPKHVLFLHAFVKVNALFKRLTITVDAQNIPLLFLNNSASLLTK